MDTIMFTLFARSLPLYKHQQGGQFIYCLAAGYLPLFRWSW